MASAEEWIKINLILNKMNKVKYKLETAGCTSSLVAIHAILKCCRGNGFGLKEAKDAFVSGTLECSPSLPGYRKMIEDLDAVGVAVFDEAKVQMPNIIEVEHDEPTYT